ncbi:bifunctional UDP-sugar hydrolase/5'-nucleotidase [Pseudoflavonifractor sp. An176]|uniref:bifunctional metallophosphatase/5'-nucleotidase n=1 Tax=Pseudoflavonifractor sp. An176 TaxID=1965572 RepID=UPI001FA88581|nr:bifunctional UDP-sugar hydrolase/5'-nucleotidase [Pseudoflavonifractor sp. An176]
MRRLLCLVMLLALALSLSVSQVWAADETAEEITILYTHDMHSSFLPKEGPDGHSRGGYARLKTLIDEQKEEHPNALVLDGGDFSMGSLFQTAYSTSALELRAMGQMGYDVTTFGNHEFDYRASGLADMLYAAVDSGDPLPAIVDANYLPPQEDEETWDALYTYGVQDYRILERGGVPYVIFGITGVDSDECAPMSGMELHDPVETAKRVVEEATEQCQTAYGADPVVICLSHSGTEKGKGEDYELARKVDGIDVIISGHTHTTLEQPIEVNDTYIVSAGENSKNLGVLTLTRTQDGVELKDSRLVPVDERVPEDPEMAAWIEEAKSQVEQDYLADFDLEFDQVLVDNPYQFDTVDEVYDTQHESTLGNLLADAYYWAGNQASQDPVDVALTASGVIRDTFPKGPITVSQVFNVASLGIGADGVPGYPLISVYLTGKDLKNAIEVDASVPPLMSAAQLFYSGVGYSFNTNRMIFDKVDYAVLMREGGITEPIVDDQLYHVVTGLYIGQMLGAVESSTFNILTVTPRDAQGNPIDISQLEDYILHDDEGNEVKEWYAIASYLQSMGGEMDQKYGQTDGRKLVYSSWNPVSLLKNAGLPTSLAILALVIVVVLLVLMVVLVRKFILRRMRRN